MNEGGKQWRLTAQIGPGCLNLQGVICRACQAQCTAGAIGFRPLLGGLALPVVDGEACDACGACLAVCPLLAIELRRTA